MGKTMCRVPALLLFILFILAAVAAGSQAAERPRRWAQPLILEGVPNLHRVDANVYRSAQPTAEGMRNLEKMGIRTIVNLRSYNSDRKEIEGTGLREVRVRMHAWEPEFDELVQVLQTLTDPRGAPYLVHCQHGADRTGMTVALYRMVIQGWSREDAVEEMRAGGYGFHEIWTEIVDFLRRVDVERIRRAVNGTA